MLHFVPPKLPVQCSQAFRRSNTPSKEKSMISSVRRKQKSQVKDGCALPLAEPSLIRILASGDHLS